jgi:hypothetical protein
MLDRAAAANPEMRAERLDALRARDVDAQQMTAVRKAWNAFNLDGLAGQRIGNEHRPGWCLGYAVTAMGEAVDDEPFGHGV